MWVSRPFKVEERLETICWYFVHQDSLDAKDSSNEGTDLGTDTKGEEKTGEEDTASLVPDKESANGDAADGKKSEDPVADKRTSNTEGGEMAVPKKRPMMNFVKASDS